MFIGNIVATSKISVDEYFNIVDSLDKVDNDLPTLIVGWDIVKTIDPKANFIVRKLSPNTYWTFKKTEKNDLYMEDLYEFVNLAYKEFVDNIKYIYIDLIQFSDKKIKKIFKKLDEIDNLVGFKHLDMIYLYGESMIFGIDLSLVRYMKLDENKLLTRVNKVCSVFLDNKEIIIEYKDFMDVLDDDVKYIPYLYSINNE
jgi:hypothetical protein